MKFKTFTIGIATLINLNAYAGIHLDFIASANSVILEYSGTWDIQEGGGGTVFSLDHASGQGAIGIFNDTFDRIYIGSGSTVISTPSRRDDKGYKVADDFPFPITGTTPFLAVDTPSDIPNFSNGVVAPGSDPFGISWSNSNSFVSGAGDFNGWLTGEPVNGSVEFFGLDLTDIFIVGSGSGAFSVNQQSYTWEVTQIPEPNFWGLSLISLIIAVCSRRRNGINV